MIRSNYMIVFLSHWHGNLFPVFGGTLRDEDAKSIISYCLYLKDDVFSGIEAVKRAALGPDTATEN